LGFFRDLFGGGAAPGTSPAEGEVRLDGVGEVYVVSVPGLDRP